MTKILKDNNIKIISNVEKLRKYEIDENYFDIIDSEHKAYTLGFLYADGYNNEKKNIVKISLMEDDIDILKQIREPICPNKPLRYYKYPNGDTGLKQGIQKEIIILELLELVVIYKLKKYWIIFMINLQFF